MNSQDHMKRAVFFSKLALCARHALLREEFQRLAMKHTILSESVS